MRELSRGPTDECLLPVVHARWAQPGPWGWGWLAGSLEHESGRTGDLVPRRSVVAPPGGGLRSSPSQVPAGPPVFST